MRAPPPNLLAAVLLSLCLVTACEREQAPPAAVDAGMNSEDAGTGTDAGTDAGTDQDGGMDAGTGQDGGTIITSCGVPYPGDPNGEPVFTPTALEPDGTVGPDGPGVRSAALAGGSTVSLIQPPQGGRVMFVGVQGVANLDPCGVTVQGLLRDPVSGRLQLDQRIMNLKPGPDGLGASDDKDIFTFANVPVCPNNWSKQDLYDHDYTLTLTLLDRNERQVSRTLTVRPACNVASQEAMCRCICRTGYKLGEPCP